jgi:hypothetical protein
MLREATGRPIPPVDANNGRPHRSDYPKNQQDAYRIASQLLPQQIVNTSCHLSTSFAKRATGDYSSEINPSPVSN